MASRHRERRLAVQALYSWDVGRADPSGLTEFVWHDADGDEEFSFARLLVTGTLERIDNVDEAIRRNLTHWTFDRLAAVDRAILRVSVYCLIAQPDIPSQVTIDEAIELAHEMSTDEAYKFVNGVLDAVLRERGAVSP